MKPFNEHETKTWDFKTSQNLHGDVVIEAIKELPKEFNDMEKSKDDCLAYGEATGHMHKLFRIPDQEGADLPSFELRTDKNGIKFLRVDKPIELKHQEHSVRVIPAGLYRIGIQREYDPFSKKIRQVAD